MAAGQVLPCKLVAQLAFKAGGDVFHEIVHAKPDHVLKTSPAKLHTLETQGEFGKEGTILRWDYTLDGKKQVAKQILQDIDEAKKTITYKWIEGDMLELYKHLIMTIHVETKGDVDFATWTFDYELLKPENPHPIALLNFHIELTTEIENHHFENTK